MWKDWKELSLVIIFGMLLTGLFAGTNNEGGLFGEPSKNSIIHNPNAQSPAATVIKSSKQAKKPSKPKVDNSLVYISPSSPSGDFRTYLYGPAKKAQLKCGAKKVTVKWGAKSSASIPPGCLLIGRPGGVWVSGA